MTQRVFTIAYLAPSRSLAAALIELSRLAEAVTRDVREITGLDTLGGRNVEDREQAGDMHKTMPVKGYTDQSNSTIDLVNRNKLMEERVLTAFDELKANPNVDQRWLAMGRTSIENGFMQANRAIFKPQRIGPFEAASPRNVGASPLLAAGFEERKKPPVDSDNGKSGGEASKGDDAEDELASLRSAAMAHRSYRAYKNWKPATNVLQMNTGQLRTMIAEMDNGGTLGAAPSQGSTVQAPYDPNVEGIGGASRKRPVSNL